MRQPPGRLLGDEVRVAVHRLGVVPQQRVARQGGESLPRNSTPPARVVSHGLREVRSRLLPRLTHGSDASGQTNLIRQREHGLAHPTGQPGVRALDLLGRGMKTFRL